MSFDARLTLPARGLEPYAEMLTTDDHDRAALHPPPVHERHDAGPARDGTPLGPLAAGVTETLEWNAAR